MELRPTSKSFFLHTIKSVQRLPELEMIICAAFFAKRIVMYQNIINTLAIAILFK